MLETQNCFGTNALETQNMSDEEADAWGEWTALGKSQQAPLQSQPRASDEQNQTAKKDHTELLGGCEFS